MEDPQTHLPVLGPVMETVPGARAWKREQQVATEAFQASTNGHQGVAPPIDTRSYAAERGRMPWSAGDPPVFGDADELPNPPPASPVATMAQGVFSHGNSAVSAAAPATARDTAPASRGIADEVIWMILAIVTVVFVVIALVLVAESL